MNYLNTEEIKKVEERGCLYLDEVDRLPLTGVNRSLITGVKVKESDLSCDVNALPLRLKDLKCIEYVNFQNTEIPDSELEKLPERVKHLNLSNCTELKNLSERVKQLSYLRAMFLESTFITGSALENLPNRFLETISLKNCLDVTFLPLAFKELKNLKNLDLSGTEVDNDSLKNIPAEVEFLNLSNCRHISEIPDWTLSSMKTLILDGTKVASSFLSRLPEKMEILSYRQCKNLKVFEINDRGRSHQLKELDFSQSGIEEIREWPSVEKITLIKCEQLSKMNWDYKNTRLKEFVITGTSCQVAPEFFMQIPWAINGSHFPINVKVDANVLTCYKKFRHFKEIPTDEWANLKMKGFHNWKFCDENGKVLAQQPTF